MTGGETDEQAQIVFTPSGRRGEVTVGTTVLDSARLLGVDIDSICGGRGICGRCQIETSSGTFAGVAADPSHLSPLSQTEEVYAERRGLAEQRRLSCHTIVLGDTVIDVPASSQVHKQVVRKRAEVRDFDVDPVVRLHYVVVAEPDLASPTGDLQRLSEALSEQWGLEHLRFDDHVLRGLQPSLRSGEWAVTVAVRHGSQVIAMWPGFHDVAVGVAFDVGSTTVAGHLCNLETGEVLASAGMMNPQIRFGEDLMSRVSFVMMNPGGDADLTAAVRGAMNQLVTELVELAELDAGDVLELTVVGNPIMHHLVLGIDPTPLGTAPFALATNGSVTTMAADLGIATNPGTRSYALPCIAGHVGADAVACILAEGPHRSSSVQLLVDVGTNAEIVLGNAERLLAASSPTGPAFEGAQISSGQRAAPGAIERVRVDSETLVPRVKVIGSDLWSDDPGFAESIEGSGVTGICGSGIIEAIGELFLAGVVTENGVISPDAAGRSDRVVSDERTYAYVLHDADPQILITQNDVRAIQLAKAALNAGARLLMDHLGVDEVDEVRLAGAFGSHIDGTYAEIVGLVPDCDPAKVSGAGNAAGTGAIMALLSKNDRAEAERLARTVEKIETAVEPRFQEHFVEAMAIPHGSAPYSKLRAVVDLPVRPASKAKGPRGRRQRAMSGRDGDE